MDLPKKYDPSLVESKWYAYWQKHKTFHAAAEEEGQPFSLVIPPPNVTGVLHMGHMLNNTIQDILIRKARMEGKKAVWVPGTDHASIATEAKVVNRLKEKGKTKQDVGRTAFLDHAWDWTNEYGGIILEQLKKLGASCDWTRTTFTLDDHYYQSVVDTFVKLYNEGYIYRGARMVNWDPVGKTALSDEEVIYKQKNGQLVYINYPLVGSDDHITIATTRPETIFADVAIAVHPLDDRYQRLLGKKARIPLHDREIPIIANEAIITDFGTGALKVTPAHDLTDFEIGEKNNLELIDILNEDGTLNEHGRQYQGKDRFEVRKMIVEDLEKEGYLEKKENYSNKVGTSERTGAVIEPKISTQWFLNMEELVKPAIKAVRDGEVKIYPDKFLKTYYHWMENIKDWCISRQLWWGHRIPAYYLPDGKILVAPSKEEAFRRLLQEDPATTYTLEDLKQDEDVLDTWFSSWLWPMEVFHGLTAPDNEDFKEFYPVQVLVTAPDILFFWVARMIIAGYYYTGKAPFHSVYLTGMVRDEKGRKMSKSLGNSPDPIKLMEEYGADGVRTGMLFSAPAGNDLKFDTKLCEQGRNFNNKVWNALRLIKGWEAEKRPLKEDEAFAIRWYTSLLQKVKTELEGLFKHYKLSDALLLLYKHVWDDFCSWYLEMVKPQQGENISEEAYQKTIEFFDELVRLIHPFMPFISEEIWQQLSPRQEGETICRAAYGNPGAGFEEEVIKIGNFVIELVMGIRNCRSEHNLSPKEPIAVTSTETSRDINLTVKALVKKLANVDDFGLEAKDKGNSKTLFIEGKKIILSFETKVDTSEIIDKLIEELTYHKGFLKSVQKKLSNERFVANAPKNVVELEQKKQSDALLRIKQIEEDLQKYT